MTTWNDYFNQKAPGLLLGKSGVKVSLGRDGYGDPALLIFKAEFHVELVEEEAAKLRDFINSVLPRATTPGGASIINCEARNCVEVPPPASEPSVEAEVEAIHDRVNQTLAKMGEDSSRETAQAMADDLASPPPPAAYGLPPTDAKASMDKLFPPPSATPPPRPTAHSLTRGELAEPPPTGVADAAAPGDEEVPLPEDETPAPLSDADKSDELVASITALIKRFVTRDSGHWAYTGDIFYSRKTTESEVILGKITDVAVLRSIVSDLEAAWAKLTAPPPTKKPKKITPRPSGGK